MAVPSRYILHQAPVIAALGQTVLSTLYRKASGAAPSAQSFPGPELTKTINPRPKDLVRHYIKHVGGSPSAYRGRLPAHLFPQWGFPLATQTLVGVDYPLQKVLNAGCRMEINAPLPDNEPLKVSARLESIDDNGRRALIHQRVVTGTASEPEALVGHMYVLVPLGGKKGEKKSNGASKKKKEPVRVPAGARELARWRLGASAGLEFAKLTGDFNPVHWVAPYARAFGFKNCILHGFSTMARAMEGINQGLLSGVSDSINMLDVSFTSPLVLPAKVGLYLHDDNQIFVGAAPGGRAYLSGSFALQGSNGS